MKKITAFSIIFIFIFQYQPAAWANGFYAVPDKNKVHIVDFWAAVDTLQPAGEDSVIVLDNLQGLLTPEERTLLLQNTEQKSNFASGVVLALEEMKDTDTIEIFLREGYDCTFDDMNQKLQQLFGSGFKIEASKSDGLHKATVTKTQLLAMAYVEEIAIIFNVDMMEILQPASAQSSPSTLPEDEIEAPKPLGLQNAWEDYGVSGNLDDDIESFTKNDVVIAVIDTGVHKDHALLGDKVIGWYDAVCPSNTTPGDYGTGADTGHGTAVASVVAAYAPGASIVAVRAKGGDETNMFHSITALDWVLKEGLDKYHIDAVVFSMETPYTSACIRETIGKINALDALGVPVFVSAGNNGPYPGSFQNNTYANNAAYVIGNVKDPLNGGWGLSRASNRGSESLDGGPLFCMPGVNIQVADATTSDGTKTVSGTSFAAPAAAGTFALLLDAARMSRQPAITIKTMDLGLPGKDPYYGNGVIDVYESVKATANGAKDFDSGFFTATATATVENGADCLFAISANKTTELNITCLTYHITENGNGNFAIVYNTKENFDATGGLHWITDNGSGWRHQGDGTIVLEKGVHYIGLYNLDALPSRQTFTMDICGLKEDIILPE